MANTEDLRYKRTEEAIRSAFLELVAEKARPVTASAICRHAGISRNAFYLHHSSVAELYSSMVNELVADVRVESLASAERVISTGSTDAMLAAAIVDALERHEQLLRALLSTDDGELAKQLAEGLEAAYVDATLLIGESGGSFEHRMSCAFAAWAHVGLVVRWIAETDRPIGESLELFDRFQAGLSESATRFLTDAS